jgi:DNA ligase-4
LKILLFKNRCSEKSLSIGQIDKQLDELSAKTEEKDLIPIFQHLIMNLSRLQLKWLIRIILKDLKLGIKEHTVLDAFHPDAIELFNSNSSIEKVCNVLQNQNNRLANISISIMVPFKPSLGTIAKPNQIENLLKSKEFYIENKYDGERFQLHKQGDAFVYFSRNGHNFTETFAKSLTPFISDCFAKDVKSIILDGEICGYNTDLNLIVPKGENINMKSTNQKDNMQPCFCVFDILLFNVSI